MCLSNSSPSGGADSSGEFKALRLIEDTLDGLVAFAVRYSRTLLLVIFRPKIVVKLLDAPPQNRILARPLTFLAIGSFLAATALSSSTLDGSFWSISPLINGARSFDLGNIFVIAVPIVAIVVAMGNVTGAIIFRNSVTHRSAIVKVMCYSWGAIYTVLSVFVLVIRAPALSAIISDESGAGLGWEWRHYLVLLLVILLIFIMSIGGLHIWLYSIRLGKLGGGMWRIVSLGVALAASVGITGMHLRLSAFIRSSGEMWPDSRRANLKFTVVSVSKARDVFEVVLVVKNNEESSDVLIGKDSLGCTFSYRREAASDVAGGELQNGVSVFHVPHDSNEIILLAPGRAVGITGRLLIDADEIGAFGNISIVSIQCKPLRGIGYSTYKVDRLPLINN